MPTDCPGCFHGVDSAHTADCPEYIDPIDEPFIRCSVCGELTIGYIHGAVWYCEVHYRTAPIAWPGITTISAPALPTPPARIPDYVPATPPCRALLRRLANNEVEDLRCRSPRGHRSQHDFGICEYLIEVHRLQPIYCRRDRDHDGDHLLFEP